MPQSDKLTDKAINAAKPGKTARKLFDGGGLYLLIKPEQMTGHGFRHWRPRF